MLNKILSRFDPRKRKYTWPDFSVTSVIFLLAFWVCAAVALGLAFGWFAGQSKELSWIAIGLGVGVVIVATAIVAAFLLVHSIANSVAPWFSTRYGLGSLERAQQMMYQLIISENAPTFRVIQGTLHADSADEPADKKTPSDKAESDLQLEMFKLVGRGPAKLFIDAESGALVERQGKYEELPCGQHDIRKEDSFKGAVDLRPQRDSILISGVMTKDIVALEIEATFVYEIKQNKEHLKHTQNHLADPLVLRRALLPQNEWQKKTKGTVTSQVKQVLRDCELWRLFIAPPNPPTPSALADLYALGQSIVPPTTKSDLEKRILDAVNDKTIDWGVRVTSVTLEQIKPPQELREAAHRTYLTWARMSEQVLQAEGAAQADLRTAQLEHQRKEFETKTHLLQADAEAQAYEKQMKARADGALEFARQIQTIRQALGTSLDGQAMRELLRALGFMMPDQGQDAEEGLKYLADAIERRGPLEKRK